MTMTIGYWGMCVPVKGYNFIHEVPDSFVIGVEDMGAIFMDVDSFNLLAEEISAQMRSPV
jgi:hypothetical protein